MTTTILESIVANGSIRESTFKYKGESVFYVYPNKGDDPVSYLESWIGDYVSDGGAESNDLYEGVAKSNDLYEGVAKQSSPTKWRFEVAGDVHPIILYKKDLVLVSFEGGWIYARIEDLMINPKDGFICKVNTVQYYYG